jgi:hypothetical protein
VIVKTPDGIFEVTRFTADETGQFRVPLFPGTYLLDPLSGPNGFPVASQQLVGVQEGMFTRVDINFDTGIR